MGRMELHTDDVKIDQRKTLVGDDALKDRGGEAIVGAKIMDADYVDELAFNEEPVTIRIEPSTDKNAAAHFPIWANGKGCEVLINGQWAEVTFLPVNTVLTVKRKYVEIIMRAKIDTVQTNVVEEIGKDPINTVKRFTSAVHAFSILKDDNPLSQAWLAELRRRNM